MITIGFDKQCITPLLPVPLRGYAAKRTASQIHDDLFVRCIGIEKDEIRYLIVQCDLIGADDSLLNKVLEKISALHIQKEHLTIIATHTHAGPGGTVDTSKEPFTNLQEIFGAPDPEYLNFLAEKISLAAHHSFSDLSECRLTIGRSFAEGIGSERHSPDLAGDNSLLTVLFERIDGKKILLYNYACHPTVTGPENTMITADFPYAVERELSASYDLVVFINSNAGDISTRFTRKDSSFEQVERYCPKLVNAIRQALLTPVYRGAFQQFSMNLHPVDLPVKKVRSVREELDALKMHEESLRTAIALDKDPAVLRLLSTYVEGSKVAAGLAGALQGLSSIHAHYTTIHLEDLRIAVIPGELFSTLGVPLKKEGIDIFGYGNGYYLYIADEKAYDEQFYEAMSSPFEKGTGEFLANEIRKAFL